MLLIDASVTGLSIFIQYAVYIVNSFTTGFGHILYYSIKAHRESHKGEIRRLIESDVTLQQCGYFKALYIVSLDTVRRAFEKYLVLSFIYSIQPLKLWSG